MLNGCKSKYLGITIEQNVQIKIYLERPGSLFLGIIYRRSCSDYDRGDFKFILVEQENRSLGQCDYIFKAALVMICITYVVCVH